MKHGICSSPCLLAIHLRLVFASKINQNRITNTKTYIVFVVSFGIDVYLMLKPFRRHFEDNWSHLDVIWTCKNKQMFVLLPRRLDQDKLSRQAQPAQAIALTPARFPS